MNKEFERVINKIKFRVVDNFGLTYIRENEEDAIKNARLVLSLSGIDVNDLRYAFSCPKRKQDYFEHRKTQEIYPISFCQRTAKYS